jgi:hypothetical protein
MKNLMQAVLALSVIYAAWFSYSHLNNDKPKNIICYKSGVKTFQGQALGRPMKTDDDSVYIDPATLQYVQVQGHCEITHS